MKTYVVKNAPCHRGVLDPAWENVEKAKIDICPWKEYPLKPNSSAKLLWSSGGISVLLESDEKPLVGKETKKNGLVCKDSCMEFFLSPKAGDARYLNIEVNGLGVMHIGLGEGRGARIHPDFEPSDFRCESYITPSTWRLCYFIPFSFIDSVFGSHDTDMRGNFYKCGDDTGHEHYVVWNEVSAPAPDYHRPEFFGRITLG